MPFAITADEPILRVTLSGTLTNEDLAALAKEARRIESPLAVVPHRLTDLRPVTRLEINFQGVLAFVNERLRQTFPNSFKSAIVATDVAHFGFARMFATLNDHPQTSIALFPDDTEALSWLAESGQALPRRPWVPQVKVP